MVYTQKGAGSSPASPTKAGSSLTATEHDKLNPEPPRSGREGREPPGEGAQAAACIASAKARVSGLPVVT
jgi:hypothetical protein